MKEIRGTVEDDIYEMFQYLKDLRHDKLNGPLLATLIHEKYSRVEGTKKSVSVKAPKEQTHE